MATGVLIQHKAKKRDEKEFYHALQSEVGGFSCPCTCISSGAGPVAEQCVLKMHVSLWTWAVCFGSVTSISNGTETPVHDLVNLSC